MILIDKSLQHQNLVMTLTELTTIVNPFYLLVLTNDFTKVSTKFVLGLNLSKDLLRYDLFTLNQAQISPLEPGNYTYSVYQSSITPSDESGLGSPIESGKALIILSSDKAEPITYNSAPTEYLTYNSTND